MVETRLAGSAGCHFPSPNPSLLQKNKRKKNLPPKVTMPEFAEIFRTKECMNEFTKECGLLVNCNTSLEGSIASFYNILWNVV